MKVSSSQMAVLKRLASCEEPLVYWNGFWTLPSLEVETGRRVPAWYAQTNTVMSLEKAGLLKQTGEARHYSLRTHPALSDRVLSAEGLAMATGCDVPLAGLVEAVAAYTGRPLHFTRFQVLPAAAWRAYLREQSLTLAGHGDRLDLLTNTSALTDDDGSIMIQAGHETDALHELVHASGVVPQLGEDVFVCEGLAQAATQDIARQQGLTVRRTYEQEVAYVETFILPFCGLLLRDLVVEYIQHGLHGIAERIHSNDPDRFASVERLYETMSNASL